MENASPFANHHSQRLTDGVKLLGPDGKGPFGAPQTLGGGDCSPIRVSMTDDQKDTVIINTVTVYEDREQNRWVHDRTMQFHSL